jgi:hypothetical protein
MTPIYVNTFCNFLFSQNSNGFFTLVNAFRHHTLCACWNTILDTMASFLVDQPISPGSVACSSLEQRSDLSLIGTLSRLRSAVRSKLEQEDDPVIQESMSLAGRR